MPMIMEDEMNVDDLFNDDSLLMIPSQPPAWELQRRIDELRGNGCHQTIAWSKWGSIASITSDGTTLELRNLRCHPDDGTWSLSEASVIPSFAPSDEGGPLHHLSWSPTGSDLAVIDAAGRVTILSIFMSLNKPTLSRSCQADPADDSLAVVGSFWLNIAPYPANRPVTLNGPGIKDGPDTDYRYESSQAQLLGPHHPNHTKSALVCVTTNGLLRLIWPQNGNAVKWLESHTELESIVSSDDLITHATICPEKGNSLLVSYATASKQLRTVRLFIDWNQQKHEKIVPAQLQVRATLRTRHFASTSWGHDMTSGVVNATNMESSMVHLSHLELLQPCNDAKGNLPATIIAIRSHLPISSSHYNQEVHSVIDRWEVCEKPQTVHPAFEQLSSRRNSVGSQPGNATFLKRLESITINKIVVSMDVMYLNRIIVFAHSDGSVHYRDRATMEETFSDGNLNEVWHLSQIGFTYPQDEHCLEVAFSPTHCSMVAIMNDGKVKWKQLDYHLGTVGTSMNDPMYAAFVTSLCLSTATAVMRQVNYDDLLATANKHATAQFAYDWLTELARPLKAICDYSEENHHESLVRNTTIHLCLSIQSSLGFKGEFNPRTFSGKFAWLVLQLRNILVLVAMAASLNAPQAGGAEKVSSLEDPEVINSLVGSIRWVLELTAWLADALLELPKKVPASIDLTSPDMSLPDLNAHLHTTNTVALHFLLSSSTRGFLHAVVKRLLHLEYIARSVVDPAANLASHPSQSPPAPRSVSPNLREAYMMIANLTSSAVIPIQTTETLLSSIADLVKESYTTNPHTATPSTAANSHGSKRNTLEIKMLFGGSFPDVLKPVIVELYKSDGLLANFKMGFQPAYLFFSDFSMLEVDDDKVALSKKKREGKTMDCFRKNWIVELPSWVGEPIPGEKGPVIGKAMVMQRWRRCARCASVMEEVLGPRMGLNWFSVQQRRCFCSGYWNTLKPGQKVA